MPDSLSEEHQRLRGEIARFATEQLNDGVAARDASREFSADAWARCAAFGIQGLPVPTEYGGGEADPDTLAVALESLGFGCSDNGLLFALGAQMWSCELPLVRFGTETQKRRYLPGLCDGSLIGAQAMTEPGSGSDAFALTTAAVRSDGGWLLNGTKTFVTNAPVADVFVMFATTDRGRGFAGVSAFLVERDTPGFSVGRPIDTMGLRTASIAEIVLTDCDVPDGAMLGKPGSGLAVFTTAMDWERTFILAPAIGTMHRQLDACVAYARERHQFDQPIGQFQSVANHLVDMKLRLETARLLVRDAAHRKARGGATALEAALTKLHLSESFVQSSLDAVQVHGGYGYSTDLEFERDVRDAVASRLYSGTSEMQRTIIARQLGL